MANNYLLKQAGSLFKTWKSSYIRQTTVSAWISMMLSVLFALYNGYWGLALSSVWHGSICVFYLLLAISRGTILLTEYKNKKRNRRQRARHRHRTYMAICILLLLLDLALIVPISMMVLLYRPVTMGLIPAIAVAAYTTCKMTTAAMHIRLQARRCRGHILIAELRAINFIDALVSILTLQNTLIMVKHLSSQTGRMMVLTSASSFAVYMVIVTIPIFMLIRGLKKEKAYDV